MTTLSRVPIPLETTTGCRMKLNRDDNRGPTNPKPTRNHGGQASSTRCRSTERSVKSKESATSSPELSGPSSCLSSSSRRGGVRRSHSSDDCLAMRVGLEAGTDGLSLKRSQHRPTRQREKHARTPAERDTATENGSLCRDGGSRDKNSAQEESRKPLQARPPRLGLKTDGRRGMETSMVLNASFSSSLASSSASKVKTGFDIDAPRPKPLLLRKESSDDSTLNNPRHNSATFSDMTEEQRAWAGIEELLSGDDNASIATRDVLSDEIVKAMSSDLSVASQSVPNVESSLRRRPESSSSRAQQCRTLKHQKGPLIDSTHSGSVAKATSRGIRKNRMNETTDGLQPISNPHGPTRANKSYQESAPMEDSLLEGKMDFDNPDHAEEHASSSVQRMMPGCSQYEAGPSAIPGLLDASFSSLQSSKSKQSVVTTNTKINNYVVQPSHAASQAKARAPGMQQFMAQLCGQHQAQPLPLQVPSHSQQQSSSAGATPRSSSHSHDNPRNLCSRVNDSVVDPSSDQGRFGFTASTQVACDENSGDEEDYEDDDHSRVLIQQYTKADSRRHSSHTGASTHRRSKLPELMDASFSSIHTEMSGILSLISCARNYVVQTDDINPMGVFLGNITRNLERKQAASHSFDCEEDRIQYMYERDEIADERRKILEEEIELYQNGGYDGEFCDDDNGDAEEPYNSEFYLEPDEDEGEEAVSVSMPSLTSLKESEISPLPSPATTAPRSVPREVSKQTLASDWRAWVDSAFLQAQAQAQAQAQGRRLGPTQQHDFNADMYFPEESLFESQPSNPTPYPNQASSAMKSSKGSKRLPMAVAASKTTGSLGSTSVSRAKEPSAGQTDTTQVLFKDEEVISLSRLRVPTSSIVLSPSELPSVLPAQTSNAISTPKSPSRFYGKKKEKMYQQQVREHKRPLVSLRSKMSRLYKFGVKGRRGSPASVLDGGRGDEGRFFPTIDEEEEEDWGTLLPN